MNLDIVEKYWKRCKGKVKAQLGKITDDQLDVISGKCAELACKTAVSPKEKWVEEEEILPRRIMLRGMLAAGCGLLLPSLLSGCDSTQGANPISSAPAKSPASTANPAAPAAIKKVSQASVQYQTHPKGEQKCSGCMNFIAESNTCKLVEGKINPEGWCVLWMKKA